MAHQIVALEAFQPYEVHKKRGKHLSSCAECILIISKNTKLPCESKITDFSKLVFFLPNTTSLFPVLPLGLIQSLAPYPLQSPYFPVLIAIFALSCSSSFLFCPSYLLPHLGPLLKVGSSHPLLCQAGFLSCTLCLASYYAELDSGVSFWLCKQSWLLPQWLPLKISLGCRGQLCCQRASSTSKTFL